jgi:hypothetical protein
MIAGIIAGLLASAALAVVTASPTSAGGGTSCLGTSANAPDGRVRLVGGDWEGGNGDYPSQGVFITIGLAQVGQAEMQWRNVGPDNLTVRVRLETLIKSGYSARFFLDGVNVTQRLRDGKNLRFPHLPPGARTGKVLVRLTNKTGTTNQAMARLSGSYGGSPTPATSCDSLFLLAND